MENKEIIGTGANITAVGTSTALSLVFPELAFITPFIEPIIATVTKGLAYKIVSNNEKTRISEVYIQAILKINERIENGGIPRETDFYSLDEYEQVPAEKIFEETLLKCRDEVEAKKMSGYSNFYSNICFDSTISYDDAYALIKQYANLSIQQLNIISYLYHGNTIPLGKWEDGMLRDAKLRNYFTFYKDCLFLYNERLAGQIELEDEGIIQLGTPEICISPLGAMFHDLFGLNFSEEDKTKVESKIKAIQAIVNCRNAEKGTTNNNVEDFWTNEFSAQ